MDGENLGPIGPLAQQTRLADVWLPQRGIFFIGEAHLEPLDADRHWTIGASKLEVLQSSACAVSIS